MVNGKWSRRAGLAGGAFLVAVVLMGADCGAHRPRDCTGISREGVVGVELLEPYGPDSSFRYEGLGAPPVALDKTSCNGIDGLDSGVSVSVEVGEAVYLSRGCRVYAAAVAGAPPLEGEPLLPVDDDDFVNDTYLYDMLFVQEGEVQLDGCRGRWLLLAQPLAGELFAPAVPGDFPPRVISRVITFDGPCDTSSALPPGTEACADVWAAELHPVP
jgi:hypothetical protein